MTAPHNYLAVIKVVGVGGGGVNAVNRMIEVGLKGVEFIAVNTDAQALLMSDADVKLDVGRELTRGLGAGAQPDVGRKAAEDHRDEIEEVLKGADMVFVTAGEGGGTGTGGAPVVASDRPQARRADHRRRHPPVQLRGQEARHAGRGGHRGRCAPSATPSSSSPTTGCCRSREPNVSVMDAFRSADQVLLSGVQGITDLITTPGLINLDFADVKSVMSGAGSALMGIGSARGDNRARAAAEIAIASPLLEASMDGAHGVLLSIYGGSDLGLFEINEAATLVAEAAHPDANIIFGAVIDDTLGDEVKVTVIAAGFDSGQLPYKKVDIRREPAAQTARPPPRRPRRPPASGPRRPSRPRRDEPRPSRAAHGRGADGLRRRSANGARRSRRSTSTTTSTSPTSSSTGAGSNSRTVTGPTASDARRRARHRARCGAGPDRAAPAPRPAATRRSVTLVAVTKTRPASDVATLARLGVLRRRREQGPGGPGQDRRARRSRAAVGLRWHLVGRLQTNKARSVAGYAHAVHSLDRAEARPGARPTRPPSVRSGRPLEVFVQVSLDGDPAAWGRRPPATSRARRRRRRARPNCACAGVMAVPPHGRRPGRRVRPAGRAVASACAPRTPAADAISAGMSDDLEAAVAHGATHVRVGYGVARPSRAALRLASRCRISDHRQRYTWRTNARSDAPNGRLPRPRRGRRVRRRGSTVTGRPPDRAPARREARTPRPRVPARRESTPTMASLTAADYPERRRDAATWPTPRTYAADVPDHRAAPAHLQRGAHHRRALPQEHPGDHEPVRDGRRRRQAARRLRRRPDLRPARAHRAGHGQGVPAQPAQRHVTAQDKAEDRERLLQPVLSRPSRPRAGLAPSPVPGRCLVRRWSVGRHELGARTSSRRRRPRERTVDVAAVAGVVGYVLWTLHPADPRPRRRRVHPAVRASWRPAGAAAIGVEMVYVDHRSADRLLRRLVPPLQLGTVSLDLSVIILLIVLIVLRLVALGFT